MLFGQRFQAGKKKFEEEKKASGNEVAMRNLFPSWAALTSPQTTTVQHLVLSSFISVRLHLVCALPATTASN